MTTFQWIGIIATVVICGGSLIFCKKKVPEIFEDYKWWVLTGGIIWLALFAYAWPHFDF